MFSSESSVMQQERLKILIDWTFLVENQMNLCLKQRQP